MDHRGDGIKIDTTAWESPRPREGGRFITGNTPSLHPYPISLSSVGDDCQRFHCGREKGKKTMEVYRCCIRIHIRETWHDFAGKFARASVFPVGAETYFRKWRSACRFKGQWGPAATGFRSRT